MRLWWWREVRPALIPPDERKVLERYGETVIQLMLASGNGPALDELRAIYYDRKRLTNAADWLTERSDENHQREQRSETLEWAILIFVFLEVVHDFQVGGYLSSGWHWLLALARRLANG
jgi:hypothetical protein